MLITKVTALIQPTMIIHNKFNCVTPSSGISQR